MATVIDFKNPKNGALSQLWRSQVKHNGWGEYLHATIAQCRAKMQGQTLFDLGEDFEIENGEAPHISLPQSTTIPLRVVNLLEHRRPKIQRYAQGISPRSMSISTDIETWINAVLEYEQDGRKLLNWGSLIGKLFLEGACAVIAIPSPAHFEKVPDFIDTLDQKRFDKLPKKRQAGYQPSDDEGKYEKVDASGSPVPSRRYWRNVDGLDEHDPIFNQPLDKARKGYGKKGDTPTFKEDRKETLKAYEEEKQHFLASRLPFRTRILSATDAIPIFGPGEELYGLIVRTEYTEEELLRRHYSFGEPTDEDGESPALTRGLKGRNTMALLEYWGLDEDDYPCVQYEIEGRSYTKFKEGDEEIPAVINLFDELGIERMPARWFWGLHLETDEPAKKAVPYLAPTLSTITLAEQFLSMKAAHARQFAFPAYAIEADPDIIRQFPSLALQNGMPREVVIKPNTAVVYPGRVVPLAAPMVGNDVNDLIRILMQAASAMSPSSSSFGGDGATSGFDRALGKEYLETSIWQVMSSGLEAVAFVGSMVLEEGVALARYYGEQIPAYANVEQVQANNKTGTMAALSGAASGSDRPMRKLVVLNPDIVGPIYDVQAYYDKEHAENLALAQQMGQDVKDGLATFAEYREKVYGDPAPEATLVKIWVDQWLRTDEGRARVASLAADMVGSDLEDELKTLVDKGDMTKDGIPMSAIAPANALSPNPMVDGPIQGMPGEVGTNTMVPPGSAQDVPPAPGPGESGPQRIGTSLPNTPLSALGGAVAGQDMAAARNNVELGSQGIARP